MWSPDTVATAPYQEASMTVPVAIAHALRHFVSVHPCSVGHAICTEVLLLISMLLSASMSSCCRMYSVSFL